MKVPYDWKWQDEHSEISDNIRHTDITVGCVRVPAMTTRYCFVPVIRKWGTQGECQDKRGPIGDNDNSDDSICRVSKRSDGKNP